MQVVIRGRRPPGRRFGPHENVHVGLQGRGDAVDFRGPAVQGRAGERFLYLTWGDLRGERFEMFRRAKLMLDESGADETTARLVADVDLSDEHGCPRCARVRPPAVRWSS